VCVCVCDVQDENEAFSQAELDDLRIGEVDMRALDRFLKHYGFRPSDQATIIAAAKSHSQQ